MSHRPRTPRRATCRPRDPERTPHPAAVGAAHLCPIIPPLPPPRHRLLLLPTLIGLLLLGSCNSESETNHHRLDLSELEGGGVVISSELWAHDRACGARLIAHWNPMGIYPFDFRNVSM